jgi:RNA polymerase sigma-70 factor (ECF subfamily)
VGQGEELESDEALMARYQARAEQAAFEALFRRWAGKLLAFFRRGLWGGAGADEVAADLVQKTFLHVHRARADYAVGRPFRPWLYTIALNVRREEGRWRSRHREVLASADDASADGRGGAMARAREPAVEPGTTSASDRLVRRALAALPGAQREVVILHWYEELSFPEIAELVGASVAAVKVRAHRAYEALRERLGDGSGATTAKARNQGGGSDIEET